MNYSGMIVIDELGVI